MRGCRHSGVRIIVPAQSAAQPTRITCRYVKPQRTMHPPQLMEGEALASRVLELGPVAAKFLGPVIMEVPHFASLRGKEREIVILRSDNGETWREHTVENADEIIHDVLNECFEPEDLNQLDDLGGGRVCRFVTYDFPQYFAVVSRIRQEVHAIGPEGGMVSSTVVPQVQAVFPQGALTKKIKVGLQAQPIDPDLTAKLLGRGVATSPIVTVEPRRRKFHKAITLSMPAPKAHSQGMINQYSGSAPTLRLLCSITGGPSRAQWEDVTGSTPLTFVNDCVSFTTTVSARFWLMDCRNIADATKMATELYREAIHVPFMAKFVVFAKRVDPLEARLRVFCMTDDKEDKTLEHQEYFTEVAKSRDVEVLEGKSQYIEMAGNLVPVTKSGEQLQLPFKAFRENRLPFSVRVKDQHADTVGRALFMREPKVAKGEPPQQPICILNIVLPEDIMPDYVTSLEDGIDSAELYKRLMPNNANYMGDLRIVDMSNLLGEDWVKLAAEIGVSEVEVEEIVEQHPSSTAQQAQAMLRLYLARKHDRNILESGLKAIQRDDIVKRCMKINHVENRQDLTKRHISLDGSPYEESDLMKDSESIEELVQTEDHRLKQLHEREEMKYSAEEKIIEDVESEEDEMVKRSVAERRQQIEKRLSVERQIPASTQKKEIVEEITTIKRHSLIEDKKARHEEEIMAQTPVENVIKPVVLPEPVIKLKSGLMESELDKSEFDRELRDKFKATVKSVEDDFEDFAQESKIDSKIHYDSTVTEKTVKEREGDVVTTTITTTKTTTVADQEPHIVTFTATDSLQDKLRREEVEKEVPLRKTTFAPEVTIEPQLAEKIESSSRFVDDLIGDARQTVDMMKRRDLDEYSKILTEETVTEKVSAGRAAKDSSTPPPTPELQFQRDPLDDRRGIQFQDKKGDSKELRDSELSDSDSLKEPRRDHDTLPKPTPRLSKSITDESGEVSSSVATEEVVEKTFSEKKIFWESLESPKDGEKLLEEVTKGARAAPIPKPRVQLSTSLSKGEESSEAPSLREDTKSEKSEISSERHVEYGESDSARSITESKSAGKEEDSITTEERLDDESFPMSERLDYSDKRDEAEDKTECVDDQNLIKTDDESEGGETRQAKFYIGESSTNIITKSQTERRSDFAYDNDGYRTTQESATLEEGVSQASASSELEKDLRMTVEKSETEISEKIRYASVKVDKSEEETTFQKVAEVEKVSVIHSPIKPYQSLVDFETPVPVQEDVVTTAKATSVDVVGDEAKKQASIESVTDSQSLKEASKIVETSTHSITTISSLSTSTQAKSTDEMVMEQTLAEVRDSLEAVQEELIETVKDGKLIKQSPSEFEFKVLPHIKYTEETIHESYQEDSSHGDVSLGEKIVEKASVSQKRDEVSGKTEEASSSQQSSTEDSSHKLEVVQRKQKGVKGPSSNRWSVTDPDNYSSSDSHYQSFEKTESRPASSDVENLLTSEYQTALDNSFRPGSTEYHSAVSTLEYSAGTTISSRESMKSFDSESSGHLASVEVSEASETLIPSTMDLEMETSEAETEEGEGKYGSLEEKGGTILLEFDDSEPITGGSMKRSQEMTFQPELKPLYALESPEVTDKDLKTAVMESSRVLSTSEEIKISGSGSYEDTRFASSLEDGSILSVSLSSASCIETVMENVPEGFDIPSLSGSLTGSYELHHKLTDDIIATSFEESDLTFRPDDVVLTTSNVMDDSRSTTTESRESPDLSKKSGKGHKRNDSTSFASFKGFDSGSKQPSDELDDLDEEMIIHEQEPQITLLRETIITEDQRGGSGSDSDYDRYETEYSRSYKTPEAKKGKRAAEMKTETFEKEMDIKRSRSPSQSIIETIEEDVTAEAECQLETQQTLKQVSQNLLDYSNVPDITITDDPNKYVSDDEEEIVVPCAPPASLKDKEPVKPEVAVKTSEEKKIQYAQEREYKMSEEQYEELLERQSRSKITDPAKTYSIEEAEKEAARGDSPGSDSFEMLEQPDISDEFVIIEEVAKEASEMDSEGKSVQIKSTKYVKKHDEDVEKYIVHSAPADPNAGSIIYSDVHNREQIGFDFEESPPQDGNKAEDKDPNVDANKRWVEMQLADNAQNLRYPYEMERGVLEDIKEEDNELEVGSSRISSFKDSFSSTPEYDVLAGRKCFTKEHDDLSMSSLQEFESLEQAISLENRRQHQGSQDSLSNGSFPKRYLARSAEGDGISLSSLKEFEGLENACLEAHLLEIKAKEEAALLLSRSDESNKSDSSGKGGKTTEITTTVTTVTTVTKTPNGGTKVMTTSGFQVLKHKLDEIEDESLPSNIMETSTDSLEAMKPKAGTSGSRRESVDSLEINKSGMDAMTSSMDSIEMMREGMTAKSSRSDADSIEQVVPAAVKSDSADSIDQQQSGSNRFSQQYEEDSIEEDTHVTRTVVSSGHQETTTTTVTRTGGPQSFGAIPKDISSDSLNPVEGDLLLTSSESLDQYTSSTCTNATYQTDRDSQMSGSMTSCDSNTMIDTLDSNVAEYYSSQGPSPMFFEDRTILSGVTRRDATQKSDQVLFDPFDPFETQSDRE